MIEANQQMLEMMFQAALSNGTKLPSHLETILSEGLIEENGCWFLKALRKDSKENVEKFGDFTGLESYTNGVHVDLSHGQEFSELRDQGFLYVSYLRKLLKPNGRFRIVMSLGHVEGDTEDFTCTVRFHKVRDDEPPYTDDIEGFRSEAVLLFTT